jgi:transcriptional regulator with XRE-family HTH domain
MTKFTPSEATKKYNERMAFRFKLFRELKGLNQVEAGKLLGYKSSGAISLIESGERGLNKTRLAKAAKVLDTFVEVLTVENDLTKDELIHMNNILKILTNKKHAHHKNLMKFLDTTK